jgi:outer membrane protein assembly factor BamB
VEKLKSIILIITIIFLLLSSEYLYLTEFYFAKTYSVQENQKVNITSLPSLTKSPTPTYSLIQSIPNKPKGYTPANYMFEGDPQHIYYVPIKTGYFMLNLTGAIVVPPTIYGDLMYVVTSGVMNMTTGELNELLGCLFTINISDGRVVWLDKFPNQIMTVPLVYKDEVIIGLGNACFLNTTVRGTGENAIIALNATNGKVIWNYTTLGEDMPTPVIYRGMVIEANGNGEVFALNVDNGKLIWQKYLGSYDSMSSLLLVGNIIYFGTANPYEFWAIDADNGQVIWDYNFSTTGLTFGGLDDSSPAYYDGIVVTSYTVHISNITMSEFLVAFNASNGRMLWYLNEGNAPIPKYLESPAPVIYHGVVYHDSPVGILYAVNVTNGKVIWEFLTGPTVSNVDIAYNSYILIQSREGTLYVLKLNGQMVKSVLTPVIPGPGNLLVTQNSVIMVGINGIIDVIPIYALTGS